MNIKRTLQEIISEKIKESNKAIIIYGARQIGKTTLAKQIIGELGLKTLSVNADQTKYIDVLSSRDADKMKTLVSGFDLLFIDEAQRIPEIGINLKIIIDDIPGLKLLVTGSSSFDLANKIREPLTGRAWTYNLFPIAIKEIKNIYSTFDLNNKLEELMIYGGYPEVVTTANYAQKKELLEEIGRSYLYKDALDLASVKYPNKILELLKLIAFQIGSESSINELSNSLDISRDAVDHYLHLLESSFVIFRLSGFSRNLRKEVSKMDKIYFYDLGIRNMVIDNFNSLQNRNDIGALWENFLMVERKKKISYERLSASSYFWRTHTGAELDYVEDRDGKIFGYEFKYGEKCAKQPKAWREAYPGAGFECINADNYLNFVG